MDVNGTKEELKELAGAVLFAINFDDDFRQQHPVEAEENDPKGLLPKWHEKIKSKIEELNGKD